MQMRYARVLPSILLALMFFGLNARAQKPTPVTDPALQELKAKAEKGDPQAQAALGLKYAERKEYAEAVKRKQLFSATAKLTTTLPEMPDTTETTPME